MDLSHNEHWLSLALLSWILVSFVASPIIGRLISSHFQGRPSLPLRRAPGHAGRLSDDAIVELPIVMQRRKV